MLNAATIGGSILIIIGLVIALLEALIGFVAFIGLAIKILILVAFLAVFASVGFLVFRAWQSRRVDRA
ncbi:MAG: hypothetical protein WKF34_14395 [Pyrinomonadaceae bacterium]